MPEVSLSDYAADSTWKSEEGAGGGPLEDAPPDDPSTKSLDIVVFQSEPPPLYRSLYKCMCPNNLYTTRRVFLCRPDILNRRLDQAFTYGLPVSSRTSCYPPPLPRFVSD